jgi:hypothetical protein
MAIVKDYHGRAYDSAADTFLETKRPGRRDARLRQTRANGRARRRKRLWLTPVSGLTCAVSKSD